MLQRLLQQKIKLSHFLCLSFFSANVLLDLKKTLDAIKAFDNIQQRL